MWFLTERMDKQEHKGLNSGNYKETEDERNAGNGIRRLTAFICGVHASVRERETSVSVCVWESRQVCVQGKSTRGEWCRRWRERRKQSCPLQGHSLAPSVWQSRVQPHTGMPHFPSYPPPDMPRRLIVYGLHDGGCRLRGNDNTRVTQGCPRYFAARPPPDSTHTTTRQSAKSVCNNLPLFKVQSFHTLPTTTITINNPR